MVLAFLSLLCLSFALWAAFADHALDQEEVFSIFWITLISGVGSTS